MRVGHGWKLALQLTALLVVAACDKGGASDGEPSEGESAGSGGGEARRPTGGFQGGGGENMYSGEALLERPELARRDIRGMLDRSRGYFERFYTFPGAAPLTPAEVPCGPSGVPLVETDWQQPTWQALRFVPRDPNYYSYQYDSVGTGETSSRFVVTAVGDLDCDGVRSTFQRGATLQADGVIASDPDVTETNRDE